ncbi:MAG: hypothetical protein R3Y28_02550 [Candidatus Gastranaerophilales bacterium]
MDMVNAVSPIISVGVRSGVWVRFIDSPANRESMLVAIPMLNRHLLPIHIIGCFLGRRASAMNFSPRIINMLKIIQWQ